MECPKCHKVISDEATECPYCNKVLSLVCPNCHMIGHSPVCEKCGYIILEKCTKCGNIVSTSQKKCKCGFPVMTSVAYNECESDEFSAVIIKFGALRAIRRLLASQDLFLKFKIKLKNLLMSQLKNTECSMITYGDTYVINFNKELSFPTSADKALRLSIKLMNAFSSLNQNIVDEFGTSLKLNIKIVKKSAEELLVNKVPKTNVLSLISDKKERKYLKGAQIVLDQYVEDVVSREYKTDSIYTTEEAGKTVVYYELKLEKYVLPPNENDDVPEAISKQQAINETKVGENEDKQGLYDFKIFDIKAKCNFEKSETIFINEKLGQNKIISIKGEKNLLPLTSDIAEYYKDKTVIRVVCTEEMNYRPWGILDEIFRQYYKLSSHRCFIPKDFNKYPELLNLIL